MKRHWTNESLSELCGSDPDPQTDSLKTALSWFFHGEPCGACGSTCKVMKPDVCGCARSAVHLADIIQDRLDAAPGVEALLEAGLYVASSGDYGIPMPIESVLNGFAGQENCDGEPYDAMQFAANHIKVLQVALTAVPSPNLEAARLEAAIREAIRLHGQPHYGCLEDAADHSAEAIEVLRQALARPSAPSEVEAPTPSP